jgi:hypothetical protein
MVMADRCRPEVNQTPSAMTVSRSVFDLRYRSTEERGHCFLGYCAAAASAVRPPTSTPAAVYSRRVYRIIIQQTVSIVRQVVGRTRSESQTVIQPVAAPSNGADYGLRIIARRPGPMHDTVDVVRCGAGAGAGQLGG